MIGYILLWILFFLILWFIIRVVTLSVLIKEMRQTDLKEKWQILKGFLKSFGERKVFYTFMATEAGLAGFLPGLIKISVTYKDGQRAIGFWGELSNNPDWLAFGIAVIVGVGYGLYLWNNRKKNPEEWRSIVDTCRFIDEDYSFHPTEKWFINQNKRALISLGNRYSPERNFPFKDMGFLLAALNHGDKFYELVEKELTEAYAQSNSFLKEKKYDDSQEGIAIKGKLKSLNEQILTVKGNVGGYASIRNLAAEIENDVFDYLYHVIDRNNHSLEYSIHKLRDALSNLAGVLSNEWIEKHKHHTLLIIGEAGTGKSHLMGDVVCKRIKRGEPSILLLGQHFLASPEPIAQICTRLDIKCRQERLLGELNEYGKRQGKPVAIVIDALNEGAGEGLWKNFFRDFLSSIDGYEYLRLIVSFRISKRSNCFSDIAKENAELVYRHLGFTGREREACEYMFESFGLDQPLWPVYGGEFANPLFLLKYCRSRENKNLPMTLDDFWKIMADYCCVTNHDIALRLNYNDSINYVEDALRELAKLMVEHGSRWDVEYQQYLDRLNAVQKYFSDTSTFVDSMIDEGLLRTESFKHTTYINFGFEKFGDYYIADCLIDTKPTNEWWSQNQWGDLSEAMPILLPTKQNKELFELVDDKYRMNALSDVIDNSGWRDTFLPKAHEVFAKLLNANKYAAFISLVLRRPFRSDTTANAVAMTSVLRDMSMSQRDEQWTILISDHYRLGRFVYDLAKWGYAANEHVIKSLSDYSAEQIAHVLVWTFTSTHRELRDMATHALTKLLKVKFHLLLPILQTFYNVNDPYVTERIWISSFATLTRLQNDDVTKAVASWAYDSIVKKRLLPEDILVRDAVLLIIQLAEKKGILCNLDKGLLTTPFGAGVMPEDIPSSEEIKARFEVDWNKIPEDKRQELGAQNSILASMATEYSRRTLYGDFGRYVFQAHLDDFGEDVEMLSNWAITMIFDEYKYSPEVFGEFDCHHDSRDRSHSLIERIGKKYQWIALNRIMAVMMDRHPDIDWKKKWTDPYRMARTIDPTISPIAKNSDCRSIYNVPSFDITKPKDGRKWLNAWMQIPRIEDYLFTKDKNGEEWINLFSYNSIISEKGDLADSKTIRRELWNFVQSYVVPSEHAMTVCKKIAKQGIQGRSFHENRDVYELYAREFYWSNEFFETILEEDYGCIPFSIGHEEDGSIKIKPTYLQYLQETCNDATLEESISMLCPNTWLVDALHLHPGDEDGIWVDENGRTIVVDNYVYGGGHSALLIKKESFLNYLDATSQSLFWPILFERQLMISGTGYSNHFQSGGSVLMDSRGVLYPSFRRYEPTEFQMKWSGYKKRLFGKKVATLKYLLEHKLIWLPKAQREKILWGDDYPLLKMFRNRNGQGRSDDLEDFYKTILEIEVEHKETSEQ